MKCRGYKVAGIQNGKQCSCGNEINGFIDESNMCTYRCKNKEFGCGGYLASQLYSISDSDPVRTCANATWTPPDSRPNTPAVVAPKVAATFVIGNCYKDTANARLLKDRSAEFESLEECSIFCTGFKYYGMESGPDTKTTCYCGDTFGITLEDSTECKTKCKRGNKGDGGKCGGTLAINVYETPKEITELKGVCFEHGNNENSRVLLISPNDGKGGQADEITICNVKCKDYKFFGMTNWDGETNTNPDRCLCGDSFNSNVKINALEKGCNSKCVRGKYSDGGDQICGGTLAISIFAVSKNHPLKYSAFASGGCYADFQHKDDNTRILWSDGYLDAFGSLGKCKEECIKKEKTMYGMEFGKYCYCNNDINRSLEWKKDGWYKNYENACEEKKCEHTNENCGGAWRIIIFYVNDKPW